MDKWARQSAKNPRQKTHLLHQDPEAGKGRHAIDCNSDEDQVYHLVPLTAPAH